MPILILLALAAACSPVPWPDAFALSARQSLFATIAFLGVALLLSSSLSMWVCRTLRRSPDQRSWVVSVYTRGRLFLFCLNLVMMVLVVVGLGWGQTVWTEVVGEPAEDTDNQLLPFAEWLVPAPYLLIVIVNWSVYYPAERAIAKSSGVPSPTPFWSWSRYVLFQARQLSLILLPIMIQVGQQSLVRAFPQFASAWWYQAVTVPGTFVMVVAMPMLLRPLLGWRRLNDPERRRQLDRVRMRYGIRVRELLLWPTHAAVANAMVIGVVPWARYVVFTDRLLNGLTGEEVDAVFGHELGHIRHQHIPYYFVFLILSIFLCVGADRIVLTYLELSGIVLGAWKPFLEFPGLFAMLGCYIVVVFGYLSRVCERQADIAGCRAGSCCRKEDCRGHDEGTEFAIVGRAICATGIRAMINALDGVMSLNGHESSRSSDEATGLWTGVIRWVRAWQHGPVHVRIAFLESLLVRPELAERHDRFAFRLRVAILAMLVIAVVVCGLVIGWEELLASV